MPPIDAAATVLGPWPFSHALGRVEPTSGLWWKAIDKFVTLRADSSPMIEFFLTICQLAWPMWFVIHFTDKSLKWNSRHMPENTLTNIVPRIQAHRIKRLLYSIYKYNTRKGPCFWKQELTNKQELHNRGLWSCSYSHLPLWNRQNLDCPTCLVWEVR